ncbi:hypothetical protein [Chitinophaga sp.]|uniref:hypothetical protein n=1 Tax=Chitinophaga sp. TaxID=1869181 RepID=UPI002F94F94F
MYDVKPNLIIGFHGCDANVRDALLRNPNDYKISQNPFDWLGHGLYFWENNYDRALQWANDKKRRGEIKNPAVVGAVLYLGYCCDLLDTRYITLLSRYFTMMEESDTMLGRVLPQNTDLSHDRHKDKILRHLDCAVIEFMHAKMYNQINADENAHGFSELKVFDSTRGVFTEGGPAFPGAALFEKSHIQICVRNPDVIKGFFMPRKEVNLVRRKDFKQPPRSLTTAW